MMDLNNDVNVLKEQFDELMATLTPDQRIVAMASINKMNKANTPEELEKIKDEEIEKVRQSESKK